MKKSIGIDIGGTKIAAGLIREDGKVLERIEVQSKTNNQETMYQSVLSAINAVFLKSKTKPDEIVGMGLGIPGKVDSQNGIAVFQNNIPWEKFPIVSRLSESFPELKKIVIENDVYQAANAEWLSSELTKEKQILIYVTISTGISSAIIKGGKPLHGNGFAGELGLSFIPTRQLDGKVRRLESVASGPALSEAASIAFSKKITTQELFRLYALKDPLAKKIISNFISDLSYSIYNLTCILDPHIIILGGSVVTNNRFLLDNILEEISLYTINEQQHLLNIIKVTKFPNEPGLIGAGLSVF
ncbi:ROK family protein [Vagococcus elongatus]|uniref:Glucokinase n=1 Tax=Vagococcus elongatus TaxID=180344 RepID=A0A430AIB4_9ENTE|nr:ROK family protein [Vagococcus elongatus]RSU07647.1 hypothetical protein CBF29_13210 [Vagococcus elongatus]